MLTFLGFVTSVLTCYIYRSEVLFLFTKPLIMVMGDSLNTPFIFTHLIEAFSAQLESCLILSFILSFLPLLIIQLFLYIIPGLFLYERRFLILFLLGTLGFLLFGFIIGYNYIVPFAWKFLLGFRYYLNPILLVLS